MSAVAQQAVLFRPMQAEDLDAVMAIEPRIYSHPWSRGNFADSLNAGHSCWICQHHGRVIGYAVMMLVLDEAHLLNISIAAEHQGRGHGRALLHHLMEVARRHGALTMYLEVRQTNLAARGLYESIGFNEFSIRKGYYPAAHGREDAVLMGLAL